MKTLRLPALALGSLLCLSATATPIDVTLPASLLYEQIPQDTTHPRHIDIYMDGTMDKLSESMRQLEKQLSRVDLEVSKTTAREMKEAMARLDLAQIKRETENAMRKIDWSQMNRELDLAHEKLSKINMEEIQKQIDAAMKLNDGDFQKKMEDKLHKAHAGLEKAQEELKEMNALLEALEKDGLLDRKKKYSIRVTDSELYINDVKQSQDVYEKYKPYYKGHHFDLHSDRDGSISL